MGGYAFAYRTCIGCGQPFSFNPLRVPSLSVEGVRQPICRRCVERANPLREARGLEPIVPADDAYDVVSEEEI